MPTSPLRAAPCSLNRYDTEKKETYKIGLGTVRGTKSKSETSSTRIRLVVTIFTKYCTSPGKVKFLYSKTYFLRQVVD